MTKTSPAEFTRWIECIPSDIVADLWFIGLRINGKEPDRAGSWKNEDHRLTVEDVKARLERGENYGVAFRGRLLVGDVDEVKRAIELKLIPPALVDTLIVRTRDAKLHLYFLNGGIKNRDYIVDKVKILELRAIWKYVVGPGSWATPTPGSGGDGLYRVVNARPPKLLKPEMLPWLKPKVNRVGYASVNFKGKMMGLPCIRVLFEVKLNHGRNVHASKLLGIAWAKDHNGDSKDFRPVAQKFASFQNHSDFPMRWVSVDAWARSAAQNKREWSCGEMITLLRENAIYPPCSSCPMKGVETFGV